VLEKDNHQPELLIEPNLFWLDFAKRDRSQPFISRNFGFATKNFSELVFALSLMALPFEGDQNRQISYDQATMTVVTQKPLVVFHKGKQIFE
jgi:hypothetical protein